MNGLFVKMFFCKIKKDKNLIKIKNNLKNKNLEIKLNTKLYNTVKDLIPQLYLNLISIILLDYLHF